MYDELHWSVDTTRKRGRDDDEAMAGALGFTEHRNKRLHSLPLRSICHKRWSVPLSFPATHRPSTLTPVDSDSEEVQQPSAQRFSPWSSTPDLAMDTDRDTDMMTAETESLHLQSGHPEPLAPSTTGRMPTPIHATFAAQVRGNNWGPTSQSNPFPPPPDSAVPRSLEGAAEWSIVQNRRLPSPISESGGEEAPSSPGMVLDASSPTLERPYLPHLPHSTNPGMIIQHPNVEVVTRDVGMMDADQSPQEPGSPTSAPATPSPRGKFGHSRSKHTLNSWTLQPGMKKSFSIGYRSDCEKCRLKIPGHFNHIILS